MSIFKKPEQIDGNAKQDPPKPSKWQGVIDHLGAAHHHMEEAMNLVSLINFDLQKGADFIGQYRDRLINTIERAGGVVERQEIEEQIKDYLPKALQRDIEDPQ